MKPARRKSTPAKPAPRIAVVLQIRSLIDDAQYHAVTAANLAMVSLYWNIGRTSVEALENAPPTPKSIAEKIRQTVAPESRSVYRSIRQTLSGDSKRVAFFRRIENDFRNRWRTQHRKQYVEVLNHLILKSKMRDAADVWPKPKKKTKI